MRRSGFSDELFTITNTTAVVPTYGAELVTNGNMELDSNWANISAPATNERSDVRKHDGTYSRHIVGKVVGDSGCAQLLTIAAGTFYRISAYHYTENGVVYISHNGLLLNIQDITGSWFNYDLVGMRTSDGAANLGLYISAGGEAYWDDISAKAINTASILGDPRPVGPNGMFITRWPTTPTNGNRVGIVIALDSPTSPTTWIQASHDGTSMYLSSYGPTYTSVITATAATWSNNAEMRIIKRGSSISVYYNNVLIGSAQTISGINGLYAAWLSTDGTLQPTLFKGIA